VDNLKASELNLKRKNKEIEKELESLRKTQKLPLSGTRDPLGNTRGRNLGNQNLAYSRGSSRKGVIDRNRSRSNQSNKSGGFSYTSNSPVQNSRNNSYNNKKIYHNNYIGRSNSRDKPNQPKYGGYNVNQMKLFGSGGGSNSKTRNPGGTDGHRTNFLARNKQAVKNPSNKASPRGSDVNRYGSLKSNSRDQNKGNIHSSREASPARSSHRSNENRTYGYMKPRLRDQNRERDASPGKPLPANSRINNYIGRRHERSHSRDSPSRSRDKQNRSINKSLNDSIEERRKRVLGGKGKPVKIDNVLPDPERKSQKTSGRNFI